MDSLNYQNKLVKQLGGSKHRVVYSASGNSIAAARLDNPMTAIEHALYWLPARNESEAQYLVAILNAPVLTEAVSAFQSRGLFGGRHFDTYIWNLPIPTFDAEKDLHDELVQLSVAAEAIVASLDLAGLGFQKARKVVRTELADNGIIAKLDKAVSTLLGLTDVL